MLLSCSQGSSERSLEASNVECVDRDMTASRPATLVDVDCEWEWLAPRHYRAAHPQQAARGAACKIASVSHGRVSLFEAADIGAYGTYLSYNRRHQGVRYLSYV